MNDVIFAMQHANRVSLQVCSALKKSYRDRLREGNSNLHFTYLKGDKAVIEDRLKQRKGHFFKPQRRVYQFSILEEPSEQQADVLAIDINQLLDGVVADTVSALRPVNRRPFASTV